VDLAGPGRAAEIVAKAEERDHAARVEEQRREVGVTAETFLKDALQDVSGFGWLELQALWVAKGGKREDLHRAVRTPTSLGARTGMARSTSSRPA
jgi:hypothetical protein